MQTHAEWNAAYSIVTTLVAQALCNVAWRVLEVALAMLTTHRTYRESAQRHKMSKVARMLTDMVSRGEAYDLGGTELLDDGLKLPGTVLSWRLFATGRVTVSEMSGDSYACLTVYQWRGAAPLIAEDDADFTEAAGRIRVLKPTSNSVDDASHLSMFTQVTVTSPIDPTAPSSVAAKRMASAFQNKGRAATFVLHGGPGLGKSCSARLLAGKLDARLWTGYDPTRHGMVLNLVNYQYADDGHPLVVVVEEFDVPLQAIMDATVEDKEKMLVDAKNKSSWNTLLDDVQYEKHLILVLTTNKTRAQLLDDICMGDQSLLREGRIDAWIDFDELTSGGVKTPDTP
jgi:hypothetical protein